MNIAATFYPDCSLALFSLLFSTEAAVRKIDVVKIFARFRPATLFKRDSNTGVFL